MRRYEAGLSQFRRPPMTLKVGKKQRKEISAEGKLNLGIELTHPSAYTEAVLWVSPPRIRRIYHPRWRLRRLAFPSDRVRGATWSFRFPIVVFRRGGVLLTSGGGLRRGGERTLLLERDWGKGEVGQLSLCTETARMDSASRQKHLHYSIQCPHSNVNGE